MEDDEIAAGSAEVGAVLMMLDELQEEVLRAEDVLLRLAEMDAQLERLMRLVPAEAYLWNVKHNLSNTSPMTAEAWQVELLFGTRTTCYLARGSFLPIGGEGDTRRASLSYVSVMTFPIPLIVEGVFPLHRRDSLVTVSRDCQMIHVEVPPVSPDGPHTAVRNASLLDWLTGKRELDWVPPVQQ